ncbi:uncharacterized protein EAF01_009794 [Botrytis porri]|uniref:Thiolase-like protein type 1 additional C-terminal domain-containing protein n=1 Tax=Botrytis porri TaxID=87229 RepID=A0A4Z1KE12_9HELO|nr:uncharacterized protein EAF01_009794 [Botrytis porri]KAF7895832.1 hypothetical protein EAF01_009794 [Botrytis porri]TGO83616.1 hypothetical protein BPOR_0618g00020 [Botrytis porri]
MPIPPQIPIIIGVGDVINRSLDVEDAIEPLELMLQSLEKSFSDTGLCQSRDREKLGMLKESVDDVRVVRNWTWPYVDVCQSVLDGILGEGKGGDDNLGEGKGVYKEESEHGGNSPVKMLDEACQRVGRGESKVAVVVGGEALESLISSASKTGIYPSHWTPPAGDPRKILALPKGVETLGTIHQIGLPIHIYPLYENAFRAHRHQSQVDNNAESAKLYAQFAAVAAGNEYAWNRESAGKLSEESIGKIGKGNRMICWPYPLLMNAFNNVNMAASCIITSVSFATELGITEDKWIYPLGGAGMREKDNFWERPNFHSSEALETSLDSALDVSGLETKDIDIFDFYSCFPIVPKLAAHHLKIPFLDPPRPITLLGGLTSFGGAGNNYSLHAITEMTRQLRNRRDQVSNRKNAVVSNGLILANGGVLTYQHVVCLSTQPRNDGKEYQDGNPCPNMVQSVTSNDENGLEVVGLEGVKKGPLEGTIETYTVHFSRKNDPQLGFVIGRLKQTGRRSLANVADNKTLRSLVKEREEEIIGKKGWIWKEEDGKRNLFGFERVANL